MQRRWALILALAVAVLTASAAALGAEEATDGSEAVAEDTSVTMYGYVANLSDQQENTPLEGVSVTLEALSGGGSALVPTAGANPCVTDSSGRFEFTFENTYGDSTVFVLSFDYEGYAVRSLPSQGMQLHQGDVIFVLDDVQTDADGHYALTGPADGPHAIVMAITTGTVCGNVYDEDGNGVSGARVTLTSEGGPTYSTATDGSGYFEIQCPYGTYTMTVSCTGFSSSQPMSVTAGSDAYTVQLEQYGSDVLLGMDSAHTLMVVTLLAMAVFLIGVAVLVRHAKRPESDIVIENDLEIPGQDDGPRHQ